MSGLTKVLVQYKQMQSPKEGKTHKQLIIIGGGKLI